MEIASEKQRGVQAGGGPLQRGAGPWDQRIPQEQALAWSWGRLCLGAAAGETESGRPLGWPALEGSGLGVPRQPSGEMEGASPAGGAGEGKDGSPWPCRSADDWA